MSFTALFSWPAKPIAALPETLHGPKPNATEWGSLAGLLKGCQTFQHRATRWISATLILLGLCTLYDQGIGDGPLPIFNDFSNTQTIQSAARQNSTPHLTFQANWKTLAGGRELLVAIAPPLAHWLYQLHAEQKIVYETEANWEVAYGKSSGTPLLAAYEPWSGKLYIGSAFWALSDGEKAAILAHEYRHSRQNWPKVLSHRLIQWVTHGYFQYHTTLESEAFDYERQARAALGLSPLTAQLSP